MYVEPGHGTEVLGPERGVMSVVVSSVAGKGVKIVESSMSEIVGSVARHGVRAIGPSVFELELLVVGSAMAIRAFSRNPIERVLYMVSLDLCSWIQ